MGSEGITFFCVRERFRYITLMTVCGGTKLLEKPLSFNEENVIDQEDNPKLIQLLI